MFYLKLLELCEKNNVQVTALLKELGMSSGNLSKWKSGNIPKMNTVKKISDYFNVTADYFFHNQNTNVNMLKSSNINYDNYIYTSFDIKEDVFIKEYKEDIINNKKGYFYCTVNDDYMSDTGIEKGTVVLVKDSEIILNNQIAVIVLNDGSITYRRYNRDTFKSEGRNTIDLYKKDIYKIIGYAVEVIKKL